VSNRALWGETTPECNRDACAYPVLMSNLCPDPKCKAVPCEDDDSCAHVESQASSQTALPAPDKGYAKYVRPMPHVI